MLRRSLQSINSAAIAIPLLGVLSALWLTRQPDWTAFTTIHIDDGIFLKEATVDSLGTFAGHNGYLHVMPRAIADLAAALPLEYAPIVFAVTCAIAVFGAMVVIWWTLKNSQAAWSTYSWLIAATLVIVPIASTETVSTAASLQWQLIAAGIVATALGRLTRRTALPLAILLLVTAASSPLAVVLLPTTGWLAWMARREGSSWRVALLPLTSLAVGLGAQLLVVLNSPLSSEALDTSEIALLSRTTAITFLEMTGPLTLVGAPYSFLVVATGSIAVIVAFFAVAAFVAVAAWVTRRSMTVARLMALLLPGVAVIAITLVIRPGVRTLSLGNPGGTRYVVPLSYAIAALIVIALITVVCQSRHRILAWSVVAVVSVLLAQVIVMNWNYAPDRAKGPSWSSSYTTACMDEVPGTVVTIPISPPPWVTSVPC